MSRFTSDLHEKQIRTNQNQLVRFGSDLQIILSGNLNQTKLVKKNWLIRFGPKNIKIYQY